MSNENDVILRTENLTKVFPGTIAVNKVDFDVCRNEVHAIIGENGAGKSTLCKMLTGLYQPDEGDIYFMGNKVQFNNNYDAMSYGINMVYQERNLILHLTGAENVMLGREPKKAKFFLDNGKIKTLAENIRENLGLDVQLDVPVENLSAGVQQSIEILRAFASFPQLLILDEPTASLSEKEIVPFLDFINEIKKSMDIAIIFISHKLDEVFQIADRVSVFTEGACVLTTKTEDTTKKECIRAMLKNKDPAAITVKKCASNAKTILKVGNCIYDNKEHNLNFHVNEGEVVGFYGLVGSGRTECASALFGLKYMEKADVELNGEKIDRFSTHEMIKKGLVMTPELRAHGMFHSYSLIDNIGVMFINNFTSRLGLINNKKKKNFSLKVLEGNNVKYSNASQAIGELSGGNMQKIIIGRSIALDSMSVIILDEPTNGLDLGAKHEVYLKARYLAEEDHKGVIFITSELQEIFSCCDRVYVFSEGNIVKEFLREDFNNEAILAAAFGRGSHE